MNFFNLFVRRVFLVTMVPVSIDTREGVVE